MQSIRPLTLTPLIRRELAACVQRLIQTSTRWPLRVKAHRIDQWVLRLEAWPDGADIVIGVQDLCFRVMHEGECWDALLWEDVSPDNHHGQWRCMDPDCQSGRIHGRLRDLLWEHLCEPLLDYLLRIPPDAQLCLYGESGSTTWAQVVSGDPRAQSEPVRCWPIPAFGVAVVRTTAPMKMASRMS